MILSILAFLITISILVVFHELGHYLCARLCGVKVLTFSIGFGPKLVKFNTKSNEWCISAIPLGGYVRMLDENEMDVKDHEKQFAFNRKHPGQKVLIAFFGPFFNILLAFLIYLGIALNGVPQIKPIIASYNPKDRVINWLNIQEGSSILAINQSKPDSWHTADILFSQAAFESNQIQVTTSYQGMIKNNLVDVTKMRKDDLVAKIYLEDIGLSPYQYLPIVAYVEPKAPAFNSGIKEGDVISMIDGIIIDNWFQVIQVIQNSPNKILNFTILRQQKKLELKVPVALDSRDGQEVGKIGIMPTLNSKLLEKNSFVQQYNFIDSVKYAMEQCYRVVILNLSGLYGILTGSLSWHNIGGPVSVAKAGASALSIGVKEFFGFLALISVSLAVVNLLPVPVLDGGHVIVHALEWLFRREITQNMRIAMFKVGLCLIIGLSIIAIYNDILRL